MAQRGEMGVGGEVGAAAGFGEQRPHDRPMPSARFQHTHDRLREPVIHVREHVDERERRAEDPRVRADAYDTHHGHPGETDGLIAVEQRAPPLTRTSALRAVTIERVHQQVDVRDNHASAPLVHFPNDLFVFEIIHDPPGFHEIVALSYRAHAVGARLVVRRGDRGGFVEAAQNHAMQQGLERHAFAVGGVTETLEERVVEIDSRAHV
jgi:hypothetical protein